VRWVLILFLSVLLCAGFADCDGGQAEKQPSTNSVSDLKPPVITEDFTLLPCPAKPKTTRDFEGCAEHKIVRSDKAINERVRLIFSRLRSRVAVARFVRSERAWLTYRRAVCESRADVYEGGSAAGVVFAECVADKNLAHLKELRAFERDLRPK
jgi:uncharacterized protein YecT (DUF1311 family)